jgi:hypothetical protein
MTALQSDFRSECVEAFMRLSAEHARIDPAECGKRRENQAARERKHVAIDHTLDQWLAAMELDADLTEWAE